MTAIHQKAVGLLTLTVIIWGLSYPILKYSLTLVAPLPFLWYRFTLASLILTPLAVVAWWQIKEYLPLRHAILLSLLGLIGTGLHLSFLYFGMDFALASRAVFILSISPIITQILISATGGQNSTTMTGWAAVLIASGALLMLLEPLMLGRSTASMEVIGGILILFSAISWGVYIFLSKYKYKIQTIKNSPLSATSLSFLSSAILATAVMLGSAPNTITQPVASLPSGAWPGLIYLAVLSSILGFVTYEAGSKVRSTSYLQRYLYFQPIVAAPVAILWLGEPITLPFLLAAVIILLGCGRAIKKTNENRRPAN